MEEGLHKNNTVEKLQQELAMRSKYYFYRFGARLQALMFNLSTFVRHATPKNKTVVQETLGDIVDLYKVIPFEQITDHPDYDLLSEINKMILELISKVEDVFNGGDLNESCEILKTIGEKGREYKDRLTALLRQQPGHERDFFG